ncbi:hypothetical protein B8W93_09175 [Lentilactobacillus kefiri]|nr:hypothetical protein B9K02_08985 [Lentilactobacillus kefiri]PAK81714.1 hypothetical protein B8W85_09315 [Lentilactobacillus kefiri]PAL05616.1 hypothetical protein B8W93_09175 [Lentilactobacillus kefiri]QGV24424.1 hypothetical protein DNL43_03735 [Lentilactobacillus kefiri]
MTQKMKLSRSATNFLIRWAIVGLAFILILYLRGSLDVHPTNLNLLSFKSLNTSVTIVLEILFAYLVASFIPIRRIVLVPTCILVFTADLYFLQFIFNLLSGKVTATLLYAVITLSFAGIIYELSIITAKTIDNLKYQESNNHINRWQHSLRSAIKLKWHPLIMLLVFYIFTLSFTK